MRIVEVLDQPLDAVCKVVLQHSRRSTFRWLVLLEVLVFGLLLCCALPFLILMFILGIGPEIPGIDELLRGRAFYHWHELRLTCAGPKNQIIHQVMERVANKEEGDALVAAIFRCAEAHGLVVQQRIGAQNIATWYGGQPLLSDPMSKSGESRSKLWERFGGQIISGDETTELRILCRPTSRILALLALVGLGPILWPFAKGRSFLQEMLDNLKGEAPWEWVFEVGAEVLTGKQVRAISRSEQLLLRHEHRVLGGDLLAIGFGASLGFDKYVSQRRPQLRWVCREETIEWPLPEDIDLGKALRDLLVTATLERRAQRPELELRFTRSADTRCTACGHPFIFKPSASCPACNTPPARNYR